MPIHPTSPSYCPTEPILKCSRSKHALQVMHDALQVVCEVSRIHTVHEESVELMIKGVAKCDKHERYAYFLSFMEDFPLRQPVITEILKSGFGDMPIDDIQPFMKLFRTTTDVLCLRYCAREMAMFISRKSFQVQAQDVWTSLFTMIVHSLHEFQSAEFEMLLHAWIRKSNQWKHCHAYGLRVSNIAEPFDMLKNHLDNTRHHENTRSRKFIVQWIRNVETRW